MVPRPIGKREITKRQSVSISFLCDIKGLVFLMTTVITIIIFDWG